MRPVVIARIYCTEAEHKLERILKVLHDEHRVAGVTAFRGIAGFGRSGRMHTASLIDASLDLPVVIECFDTAETIDNLYRRLQELDLVEPGHFLTWTGQANLES
jgi:PII-like signaling protein